MKKTIATFLISFAILGALTTVIPRLAKISPVIITKPSSDFSTVGQKWEYRASGSYSLPFEYPFAYAPFIECVSDNCLLPFNVPKEFNVFPFLLDILIWALITWFISWLVTRSKQNKVHSNNKKTN